MGGRAAAPGRRSGLELMRILLMLLIIAHHYVVNSGVTALFPQDGVTASSAFLVFFGMWGKVAINSFVMITGYFMCASRLTWVKVARLLGVVYFWIALFGVVFLAAGVAGPVDVVKSLLVPFRLIDTSFVPSFLVMYCMIPFLNRLLSALDKKGLRRLLGLLLFVFTFCTTFLAAPAAFSEVGWYCTLYLLAAYVRLYPARWFGDLWATGRLLAACAALSVLSVAAMMALDAALGLPAGRHAYWFVNDSGKLMAFLTGAAAFLFFKNLDIGVNRAVNAVSATVFGVLMIHANSDAMRAWLWGDLVDVPGLYEALPAPLLALASCGAVLAVFAVCSAMDALRIRLVERPLFAWVGENRGRIEGAFRERTAGLRAWVERVV